MLPHDQNNRIYDFHTEKGKGTVGTVIFHIILIAILFAAGFTSTPPQAEEGLLVNFGTDDFGSGMIEPSQAAYQDPATSVPVPQPVVTSPEKAINTQDYDKEAPEIKKVTQTDPEAEKKRADELEAERIKQAELEAERIRLEQEELERKKKEEEERRTQEILDKTKNLLTAGKNTGTTSTGEGAKTGTGNQGVTTGNVDATMRGVGSGQGIDGTSWSLAGRSALELPKAKYDIQEEGTVVVTITVDPTGRVVDAVPGAKGSTTINEYLLKTAKEAALLAKFDPKPDAALLQKGTITYFFKLN